MSTRLPNSSQVPLSGRSGPRKILMVAYACGPNRGSEPGVGWHRAMEMARRFEVSVIAEKHEFEESIERYLREHGAIENLHFHFVPRVFASDRVWRGLSRVRPLYYLAYALWHRRAYRTALEIVGDNEFDLVHQSTMCGFREPGRMWRLDLPFIWGPVGGTQQYPMRFLLQAGLVGSLKEGARSFGNALQLRFSSKVRQAARRADALLTAIPAGQRDFKRIHGVDSIGMLDVGVGGPIGAPRTGRRGRRPLRLLWSGVLGHHKALQLLIRAMAELPEDLQYELRIMGRGPRRRAWQRLSRRLGVEKYCTWLGFLPHDEAMKQYGWADIFVFTSLRDTCGTVVLEALSCGLPVICLDHQGVGSVITESCGIKVPVSAPREVITGLRDAVVEVSIDEEKLVNLSRGAVERAHEHTWKRHGDQLEELYREVFARNAAADGSVA